MFVTAFLSNSFGRIPSEGTKSAAGRGPRVRRRTDTGAAAVLRTEITLTADKRTNTGKTSELETGIKKQTEAEVLRNQKTKRGPSTDEGQGKDRGELK